MYSTHGILTIQWLILASATVEEPGKSGDAGAKVPPLLMLEHGSPG